MANIENAGKIRIKGRVIETEVLGFFGVLDVKHKIPVLLDPNLFEKWKGKTVKVIIYER